jgi:hypothetical protein
MFLLTALLLHDAGYKPNQAKLLPLISIVCMFWCGAVWSQDAPADLRLGSNAPSIHTTFDGRNEQTGRYRVLLKNVSSHAVTGYSLGTSGDSRAGGSFTDSIRGQAAIVPGGILPLNDWGKGSFFVQSVLFDDGSYEGDPKKAVILAARRMGRLIQWEEIKPRIDQIVATDGPDYYKIELIRTELINLAEDPEPAMMDRLKKMYPTVPLRELSAVETMDWLQGGLKSIKRDVTKSVDDYEQRLETHSTNSETITQWWSRIKPFLDPYDPDNK